MRTAESEFVLTESDYLEVERSAEQFGISIFARCVCAALLAAMFFVVIRNSLRDRAFHPVPFVALVGLLLLIAKPYIESWELRRKIRKTPGFDTPMRCILTDNTITRRAGGTEVEIPWKSFYQWRELDKTILLYERATAAVVIPKRAFSEGDVEWLRGILATQLGKPK